jgi:hypothetical protein
MAWITNEKKKKINKTIIGGGGVGDSWCQPKGDLRNN